MTEPTQHPNETIPYAWQDLVERAVKWPTGWKRREPRWVAIMRVFNVGSTTATRLCRHFGLEPEKTKP